MIGSQSIHRVDRARLTMCLTLSLGSTGLFEDVRRFEALSFGLRFLR